jgi:glyceraldehyde-3-phosphate dehydrogenase (NAD(P))
MKILVNGVGTIGTTLLGVLNTFKNDLNISHIYALKNTLHSWCHEELSILHDLGIEICTQDAKHPYTHVNTVIDDVDYIFDCTANGFGLKNKVWYQSLKNVAGCSAQGSEHGFGIPFMTGINGQSIMGKKYVQIVSCNTHSIAAILKIFCGEHLFDLAEADFVVVRRCEDIGNHERLVTANVVSRHLSPVSGTHHAIDALKLYDTVGLHPKITSSDITTPSQLMHSVRFNIKRKSTFDFEKEISWQKRRHVSTTAKFDQPLPLNFFKFQ